MFKWADLVRLYGLLDDLSGGVDPAGVPLDWLRPSYNVAPTQPSVTIREHEGERVALPAVWGLRPAWMETKLAPINAKSETVATSPMFRGAWKSRRCIVPASGFYEWRKVGEGKVPHYIHRADGALISLAGLYEAGEDGDTFTILTCPPNQFMARLHDRMPVILEPESIAAWLGEPTPSLLRPAPEGVLVAHPVSRRVNSPKVNDESLVKPAESTGPASLFE